MLEVHPPRGLLAIAALAAGLACNAALAQATNDEQAFAEIERGRYLSLAADCAACHDDPVANRPFAGGRSIQTPFGVVVAPNITPDRDSGIGAWSDAQFDAALRQGRMPDGRRLYPAMPFAYYTRISAADVHAIRAFLATIAPVRNTVIADRLPFPFNIRASMRLWDALYFRPGEYRPQPQHSAQWNRGAYLVEGPGHCGACHTPKNFLGGDDNDQPYQGYVIQGWLAPDLSNDQQQGLSDWSVADIVDYLKKGHNRLAGASGPMGEEVSDSSSQLREDDLQAIATFLKDLPGQSRHVTALRGNDPVMRAGAAIYMDLCSACHAPDGQGVAYLIPNLAASNSVASPDPTTVLHVVLAGAQSVATAAEPTGPAMPGYAWQLTDLQVAAVASFVRNSWGHAAGAVSASQVHDARERASR
jgi:mono/diheme cytochrome c family protein